MAWQAGTLWPLGETVGGDDAFDKLILRLYDAAYDPVLWPDVLARISELIGAHGTQFLWWDKTANALAFTTMSGYSTEAQQLYGAYYGAIDPRRQSLDQRPVGVLTRCHEYFDEGFVRKSEFYNDFLIPQGSRYLLATRLADDEEMTAVIGIHKNKREGAFEIEDAKNIDRLIPHLVRAAQFSRRFTQLRETEQTLDAALDQVEWGIVIVDADARIVRTNAAARALLSTGDGLRSRQGRLTASRGSDATELARLIHRAAMTATSNDRHAGGAIAIERSSAGRALNLVVGPLSQQATDELSFRPSMAIVFVTDPEQTPQTPTETLQRLYGLTAAEAHVAAAVAGGLSIEAIAEAHDKSRNTVRVQMQSILEKTGTGRQAELVSLLLKIPTLKRS